MDGECLPSAADPVPRPQPEPAAPPALSPPRRDRLRKAVSGWFAEAQRPLPWREGYDPYAIWVSEMMLQQTQVDTVKPYFARWMRRFPDVAALAAAPLETVLKHWEGLGYYARARNLHKAARVLVADHGGVLPRDPGALATLPGIGPYSAGAIASIAYDVPAPIVDGNVARVLSRWFALEAEPGSREGKAALWALAEALVPAPGAREFNQGLMELGALVCRARDPLCGLCPVRDQCRAHAGGDPARYPLRRARPERPRVAAVLAVFRSRGRVLLRRRPEGGLWGGLWEFPWVALDPLRDTEPDPGPRTLLAALGRESGLRAPPSLTAPRPLGTVRHGLTHRIMEWQCWGVDVPGNGRPSTREAADHRWADAEDLAALPMGRPMRKVLNLTGDPAGV